jgi:enoyl-CoA hydratase/carnithine racemase/3-hydroxyacyl-CoA dehydrogenase
MNPSTKHSTLETTALRRPTLDTLGLGAVLDIFKRGRLPATVDELVDRVFGKAGDRGCVVISGANGIVGAGKAMQLSSRLEPYGVKVVGLDFPNAPDGIGAKYAGLVAGFGKQRADAIMANVVRLTYDGKHLPEVLKSLKPRFLLEAIPEILEIKRAHYEVFRKAFPGIEIRSVTSGFPSAELGVGVAHPAFPHEINKIWEVVEQKPSDVTRLLWALGMIPVPVSDHWSFVLDVLFCGLTLAASRVRHGMNMPYWKIDKFVRRDLGPNPFRAHDAIGAAGANFLTWSCLHHLSQKYGAVFEPTTELAARKDTGQTWYPLNHFRPLVDWKLTDDERETFETWVLGPLFQMTSLIVHENRSHPALTNAIGEICAQFTSGVMALSRRYGKDAIVKIVGRYHRLHPEAAKQAWHPDAFDAIGEPAWQQLYVNAEHDGHVGVLTISREAYNHDVDAELNRAIDWLKGEGIRRVILTGDFHLSTQMVGADTRDFYPALSSVAEGKRVSATWSRTARRLHEDFETSVGYVAGKRALGGMLELLSHCHYLVAHDGASLGFPEVTLPVVPGMEGCHWPLRKAKPADRVHLLRMLLSGRAVKAQDAVGWLLDWAGPEAEAYGVVWRLASGEAAPVAKRALETGALKDVPQGVPDLAPAGSPATAAAREAILGCVRASAGVPLAQALEVQSQHSADFMVSETCKRGAVGTEYVKTTQV